LRSTRTPRSPSALLLLAVAAASLLAVGGSAGAPSRSDAAAAAAWRGLVGAERPRVSTSQRSIVLLKAPALADRLDEAGGYATESQMRQWAAAATSAQKQFAAKLAGKGIPLVPELTFTRVVNGFSAPLDPRGVALLERDPDVLGVYPVRAAYPASLSSRALGRSAVALVPGPRLPGFDGTGVTVAVLDTGIDATHPYLRGRVAGGIDIVSPEGGVAAPQRHPRVPGEVERHGTQLAGIVAGAEGPGGLHGVAPGARILPIRVAGWQADAAGGFAVYGRSDQLLAGIERAVDPNGDGSVLDAARVALVGVAEPFAAFPNSALARAVAGAATLDTLVVAPAGNDGPAGPAYGSVGGPAGAPDALAVGAEDGRGGLATVRVMLRAGLQVLFDDGVPLGGAVLPERPLTVRLAVPRARGEGASSRERRAAAFFDARGFSLVAGRAALVSAGAAPQDAQRDASLAGAAAVVVEGLTPAGALGLDERVGVPVVGVPTGVARAARRSLEERIPVTVSIGVPASAPNPAAGRIAPFSSRGLAFGGGAKPEVAAAGIAVTTAEPGRNDDGTARYGTVNGTSAAAAVVAGAAAVLAEARPALDARGLRGTLVGTARVRAGAGLADAGGGGLDLPRAAAAEVVAEPATLTFGPVTERGATAVRTLTVRNVSSRRLGVGIAARLPGAAGIALRVEPRRLSLARGESARVRVQATVDVLRPRSGAAEGSILLRAADADVRVPWTIAFPPPSGRLLASVELSDDDFTASDRQPTVLSVRAGLVETAGGVARLQPVEQLDVELWHKERRVGTLARLRDVLPGTYAFGITGRGPYGKRLPAGAYRLRIVASPVGGGAASVADVRFRLA
jgi:subtilisin family serine protease